MHAMLLLERVLWLWFCFKWNWYISPFFIWDYFRSSTCVVRCSWLGIHNSSHKDSIVPYFHHFYFLLICNTTALFTEREYICIHLVLSKYCWMYGWMGLLSWLNNITLLAALDFRLIFLIHLNWKRINWASCTYLCMTYILCYGYEIKWDDMCVSEVWRMETDARRRIKSFPR